ncbi:MAG: tyrosine-protein phosphatase [Solobacterium sp.]|jgi:protein-tyrosine phosphatase|nr:tyrosine-protein phosphatase [Solobacterium sp.]MCH4221784.1 tyrosine-protein phosphatase [Solobacterium sp.]
MMEGFRRELNFRELGGIQVKDGRRVKHGCFYRSSPIASMNAEEQKTLSSLGIKVILDLRSDYEAEKAPDPDVIGAEYIKASAAMDFSGHEVDFSPEEMEQALKNGTLPAETMSAGMRQMYSRMPFNNPAWTILFDCLKQDRVPMLYHCSAGKDRTGTASELILLALGAEDQAVLDDYMMSNVYRSAQIEALMNMQKDTITAHPEYRAVFQSWEGVLKENMIASLQAIIKSYGTYEAYFLDQFDLDQNGLDHLRDLYLE